MRKRCPSPTALRQLENVLQEEWYKTPLKLVRVHSKKTVAVVNA
jgi:hypothetical protein